MPEDLDELLQTFLTADVEDMRRLLETEPALLEPQAAERLDDWARAWSDRDEAEKSQNCAAHSALLRACAEEGVGAAFEAMAAAQATAQAPDLGERLMAALTARSWQETRDLLEAAPQLYGEAALALLAQLRDVLEDAGARAQVEEHLELFRRCAEVGVGAAFAESSPPSSGEDGGELSALLARIGPMQGYPARVHELVALCDLALDLVDRPAQDRLWAALQDTRANALLSLGELAGDPAVLAEAVRGYDAALEVRTRKAMPADWARTQSNRAAALQRLG
ncbi:hypothetical protein, partial [Albimonas pacifica]|uniref:hypothetical protein n=1 Tax=Albimonas pacifica TaxID=1114924 RepID=UPI001C433F43